jgi:hypothetical protein
VEPDLSRSRLHADSGATASSEAVDDLTGRA